MTVLRADVLAGRTVAIVGAPDSVRDALRELGARVVLEPATSLDAIVYDATPAFGEGGQAGLRTACSQAWSAISEVATDALIPARCGKVVMIAPGPDAGLFAQAARAALENLARTLSVEWARFGITTTMIAPGPATTAAQLAELACFLVSPAGDYFSGCRFSLAAGETTA
jgi:NAD(P)-dependent dehydrogenase (short-subunit alcohol dehydrogenase family)